MTPRITAGVIAQNEERHITGCLSTLAWADETIVLDGGSTDRTRELAAAAGATVRLRPFDDFAHQRRALIEHARGDWLLFVDADERVPVALAAEILATIQSADAAGRAGFWIPRRNYIWGKWIKGGGWYPDAQLRLLRRDRARYRLDRPVHELPEVDFETGTLACALVHYNYDKISQFVRKQRRYAALEASERLGRGESSAPHRPLTATLREAWRRAVVLGGRHDGLHGVALATLTGLAAGETQLRLLRRLDGARPDTASPDERSNASADLG